VLEGVSSTPGWAASFFGDDMRPATKYQKVGFWFHRNCWPFVTERSEGFASWLDPLPLLVAEIAWPLELLRIKGALKGGALSRNPKGLPPQAAAPLTAKFPAACEALGLNYHHLDVNIGKCIVPGPSPGREYDVFEAIQQDLKGSYIRAQVRTYAGKATPQVLCVDSDVVDALVAFQKEGIEGMEGMEIKKLEEMTLRGNTKVLFKNLLGQGNSFQAVFLPQDLLNELPAGLLAAGGRAVATEILPGRDKDMKQDNLQQGHAK
jgi:hypothetical protein